MPEARGFCRPKAAARLVVMLCSPQPPEGSIIETAQTLTREVTLFMNISVLLFDGFEALDAFGPVEVFSKAGGWNIGFYSFTGGIVTCAQGIKVQTEPFSSADKSGVLLVPGGMGTRRLVGDAAFLEQLIKRHTAFQSAQAVRCLPAAACLTGGMPRQTSGP